MFYYYIPRMAVIGSLTTPEGVVSVTGSGWYDHEFGGTIRAPRPGMTTAPKAEQATYAWNWLSLQLEDGTDITATTVFNPDADNEVLQPWLVHLLSQRGTAGVG